jgi:hypothetical protein
MLGTVTVIGTLPADVGVLAVSAVVPTDNAFAVAADAVAADVRELATNSPPAKPAARHPRARGRSPRAERAHKLRAMTGGKAGTASHPAADGAISARQLGFRR